MCANLGLNKEINQSENRKKSNEITDRACLIFQDVILNKCVPY